MAFRPWDRIIRFVGEDNQIHQGEPILDANERLPPLEELKAKEIKGDIFDDSATVTDKVLGVRKLLSPLSQSQVPIIRCIGLNYLKHAQETKREPPKYPVLFIKPGASIQDPFAPIRVPYLATNNEVDYEVELAVAIKKPCKDVSKEDALKYVLGYTVANDVTARKWQKHAGGGQWCFSKGYDTFAPIGPMLVSPRVITNPNTLRIRTVINGTVMQDSNTSDMLFHVPALMSFLSQGTTLQPGSLILTGTPEGVGYVRTPPVYLQHGDEISVEVEKIGTLTNKVVYEKGPELLKL